MSFVIGSQSAPLPDLLAVTIAPCAYAPVDLRFNSLIYGKTAAGDDGVLLVAEKAAVTTGACAADAASPLTFAKEVIQVVPFSDC